MNAIIDGLIDNKLPREDWRIDEEMPETVKL